MGTNWFAAIVRGGRSAVTAALVLFAAAAYAQAPPVFVTPQSDPVPIFVPPAAEPVNQLPVLSPAPVDLTPVTFQAPEAMPLPIGSPMTVLPAPTQLQSYGGSYYGKTSMRDVFVGTLAAAAQATGTKLIMDLTQAVAGGLTNWFSSRLDAKARAAQQAAAGAMAAPGSGAPPVLMAPPVAMDTAPASIGLPAPVVLGGAEPQLLSGPPAAQFFDAQTGTPTAADPMLLGSPPPSGGPNDALFAGLAYEVHAIQAGGASVPVNPATHVFQTGDRFVVLYRPTLPGRMAVYNVNPAGRRTQIDSVELAGGQLARLGQYEFAATKGDEQLRLVLTPCTTPALTLATRDIVRVADVASMPAASLSLAHCEGLVTRSIDAPATRDIRKIAVEGTTGFALDPIAADERESGRLAPREVTINFRHR